MINHVEQFKDTMYEKIAKAISPNQYLRPNPREILRYLNKKDEVEEFISSGYRE